MTDRPNADLRALTKEGADYLPLLTAYLESASRVRDQDIHRELLALVVDKFVALEKQVDDLLKNTLPPGVAEEIRYLGTFAPRQYNCTILFSDVTGFTRLAEELSSATLVAVIDDVFRAFDRVVRRFNGTKIKTIGDAYMVVFGAPTVDEEHPVRAVRAALAMQEVLAELNRQRYGAATEKYVRCRIGIHSGPVTAGVVGEDRMQFDVFGDHVNIAARFETAGEPGRVNISAATRRRLPPELVCEDRGEVALKHKKAMRAYFVRELSADPGLQED
ncbi:adenylate/guanylate cyclase domain-containing protein [Desulfurivibrio dismutans]|uniref:adenylate/guanylate cyclase domain-containing protein n=1 Tax=Desulfurivibrio dismutans TaxID=1398908 RepID=UPI0023DC59E4|nr:adenylate/guanylate cyclase domain-containing protein [Desulfurivibrio alkaliphilus]MDF1613682.1 adenylate/guanylate cyclase domain-containing protein [Desulfurivibrio alkaliphilus]